MSDAQPQSSSGEPTEVCCRTCGQTFMTIDLDAAVHVQRRDGELCGGAGVPFRPYVIRNPNRW